MNPGARRLGLRNRPSTLRVLAMIAAVAVSTAGWATMASDPPEGMLLGAEFADASPLITGVDVRIDGVPVGIVTDMTVVPGDDGRKRARVSMNLENAALPVHSDATATVRASSLLGERFVDLDRGSGSAPVLAAGRILPPSQTGQATDLDQVLNTFDQPTSQALAELLTALGHGIDGNGENLAATLKALGPAMADTGKLTTVLREQNELLGSLVDRVQPVAGALADDRGRTMNRLVSAAARLTGTTSRQHRQLSATIAQLPATLATARRTLGKLASTAEETAPTLKALRPMTDDLTAISSELRKFSSSATRAMAHTEPVLEHAERLLVKARPVAADLRKTAPHVRAVSGHARPVVEALTGNIGNVLDFIRNWALTTNGHDGISHYFRAQLVISPEMLEAFMPQQPASKPSGAPKPGPLPQLPEVPGGLLEKPTDALGGGVTGLTEQQESDALGFLLGGGR